MIATSVDVDLYQAWQGALLIPLAACAMIVGGAVNGVIIGVVGQVRYVLPGPFWDVAVVVICLWACALDLFGGQVPTSHWLVPRAWARWPWPMYPVVFGAVLGVGWLTMVPFASYYLLVAILVIFASTKAGVLTMAAFGLARSIPLVIMARRIHAGAGAVGGGMRALVRRQRLHAIASSGAMRIIRTAASVLAAVLVLRQS